jgi:hypothetical protein
MGPPRLFSFNPLSFILFIIQRLLLARDLTQIVAMTWKNRGKNQSPHRGRVVGDKVRSITRDKEHVCWECKLSKRSHYSEIPEQQTPLFSQS